MAKLGPHWLNYHGYGVGEVATWKSDWVKLVDPDPEQAARLKNELRVKLVGRLTELSTPKVWEHPLDVAVEDFNTVRSSRAFGSIDVWETINEPGALLSEVRQRWLRDYFLKLIELGNQGGVTIAWGSFATGTPPGKNDLGESDWSPYFDVIEAAGTRHPVALHEYWGAAGPDSSFPWWSGRLKFLPGAGKIMITECGLNRQVGNPAEPEAGWSGAVSQDDYIADLAAYLRMINSDPRVLAAFVFTLDVSSAKWISFDTRGLGSEIGKLNAAYTTVAPVTPTPNPAPTLDLDSIRASLTDLMSDVDRVVDALDQVHNQASALLAKLK